MTGTRPAPPAEEAVVHGLPVRMVAMPAAHTVGACLRVGAGSAADPAHPWGTAHLTEHVRIAAAGGEPAGSPLHIIGRTENSETRFTMAGLAEQSTSIAGALARLLHSGRTVDAAAFDAERHAVRLEGRALSTSPLLLLGPASAEAAVPGARMAAAASATAETIGRISAADVEAFTAEHYRPDNAVLTIAGALPPRELLLEAIAETLTSARSYRGSRRPEPADGAAPPRPPLRLPPTLDGLLVLTLPAAGRGSLARSVARALAGAGGPFVTGTAAAGHTLIGRTAVSAGEHEVAVLCWRDEPGLRTALATAFAAVIRADEPVVEAWRAAVLAEFQEHAFARESPLGRAQCELLPPPQQPLPHLATCPPVLADDLRRTAELGRVWRLRSGILHASTTEEDR